MANTFLIDHLFKNTIFKKTKTQKKTNIKFLQKEVRNFNIAVHKMMKPPTTVACSLNSSTSCLKILNFTVITR